MENFELVIVGSDEVWNLCHPWYGGQGIFFGRGLPAESVVSYAASFGNYSAWWGIGDEWKLELEKNFDAISVRDENSRAIVYWALGRDPDVVLDPCLLYPAVHEERERRFDSGYAVVYGHGFSNRFAEEFRRWTRSRGKKLVSIGYRNDWADEQFIAADPHEFASLIAGADAVATNYFHGCVFSLINRKPFVCETTEYRLNKVNDLMTLLGGERHILKGEWPSRAFDALLEAPPDAGIHARIAELRKSSEAYLERAIGV